VQLPDPDQLPLLHVKVAVPEEEVVDDSTTEAPL
jgi:hypothetical protein